MTEPTITIRIDGNGRVYRAGEKLSGEYRLEGVDAAQIASVEISVLWHTEGKGDEDMAVHEFWRFSFDEGSAIDVARPGVFTTTLPHSPLSYEGRLISLRWCVRVRAFLQRGRELVGQHIFRLGDVPAVAPPPPARAERAAADDE